MSARSMVRARARADARRVRRAGAATAMASAAIAALGTATAADGATIQVTSTANSGAGTLRAALDQANGNIDADTITFASTVTGTINLTSTGVGAKYDTTIVGPGAGALTLNATAAANSSAFGTLNAFTPGSFDINVSGLTFTSANRSAVQALGVSNNLTFRDCVMTGHINDGNAGGGGIYAKQLDSLNLIDSKVIDSTSAAYGGGIDAINTDVTISGSQILRNTASKGGAGVAVRETGAGGSSLAVQGSTFQGNTASTKGGAITVNSAVGAVTIEKSTITGNSAASRGGGVYTGYTGPVTIDSSTISQNGQSGTNGGGLFVYAPSGPFTLRDSTLYKNDGFTGGGLNWFNYYDKPGKIENSTIVGNTTTFNGGGIYRNGFDASGTGFEGPDNLTISSSVVSGNKADIADSDDLAQGGSAAGGFITDHSLVGTTVGGATITDGGSNKLNAGVTGVAPIADNGGPTQTMLPDVAGPLIDAGASNGLTTDQRGLARTQQKSVVDAAGSDGTDIGAVELPDTELFDPALSAKKKQKVKGRKVRVVVEASAGEAATATVGGSLKLGKKSVPLADATAQLTAGDPAELTLGPASKKASRKIAKVLKKGKKPRVTLSAEIADAAGNKFDQGLNVKLKGKKKKAK